MNLTQDMLSYLHESQEELKQLIRDLCAIPAPSHHEEKRAAFCCDWFRKAGFDGAHIDPALNVVAPYNLTDGNDVVVFMAHTDTVFPDLEPLPFREDDEKMYCPGVCDDTANLAIMMICARYMAMRRLPAKCGVLFVANSCEEGLGNLKGCRRIAQDYGPRMRALIAFDGCGLEHVVTGAVGSHRYRVEITTEGGHSYGSFGNRNAIRCLASMIDSLYSVKVPVREDSRTTYNVGTISGGTSVNTIAQQAEMLYEYRSTNRECLAIMQDMFEKLVEAYRAMGITVNVDKVGDRPCTGDVDPEAHAALIALADQTIRDIIGKEPRHGASSTDCNIPLSLGIPSVCLGVAVGAGAHTRGESLTLSSLPDGSRLAMNFIMNYFEA